MGCGDNVGVLSTCLLLAASSADEPLSTGACLRKMARANSWTRDRAMLNGNQRTMLTGNERATLNGKKKN